METRKTFKKKNNYETKHWKAKTNRTEFLNFSFAKIFIIYEFFKTVLQFVIKSLKRFILFIFCSFDPKNKICNLINTIIISTIPLSLLGCQECKIEKLFNHSS